MTDVPSAPTPSPTPSATPEPAAPKPAGPQWRRRWWEFTLTDVLAVLGVAVIAMIAAAIWARGGGLLDRLQETASARGLITFVVVIVTVMMALIVVIWVVATNEDGDTLKARFTYAKDVLSTLVGILGTILGFYFASATDKPGTRALDLTELHVQGTQLAARASGGTPPFRFKVSGWERDPIDVLSPDGWLIRTAPTPPAPGTTISLDVTDANGRSASQKAVMPAGGASSASPPASAGSASAVPASAGASR